ncbi:MAG TPA: FAD-binding oxidoreductase [Acidobacteriaceae bacterium]|nr:FAD-binding oxidoreductase [Acidobacteriaceae bacterium]
MDVSITRQDPRYQALLRGHNLRFPENASMAPARIVICTTPADVHRTLQTAVHDGLRPTVRSGGHCYENFTANNPGGVLLDLSLLNTVDLDSSTGEYCVAPGAVLGDVYQSLYKQYGLTLPGGSCYSVGAGGHISGGGYGMLSRLHGLTSDWLAAVDILTVDASGRVIERRVDRKNDPDLFRACRGAGGAGFGIITAFRFKDLPVAPREVVEVRLRFPWETMPEDQFVALLTAYGDYWATRGRDQDTWGLFTLLGVGSRRSDGWLGMHLQFCQRDGKVDDISVLREFLARFDKFDPVLIASPRAEAADRPARHAVRRRASATYKPVRMPWLEAAISDRSGGDGARAKYKSAYMKRNFAPAEARAIYRFYSGDSVTARSSVISIDSYGGAVNRPQLATETAIAQRGSIMKLQWQCYWFDPAEDAQHLHELDAFYTSIYTGEHVDAHHQGTPWGDRYEGCYMNYADVDMLRYPYWPELFYGRDGLYEFLQKVKQRYDPNNVFHHAMSVRTA